MFYTGIDPRNMEAIYVPREAHEKAMQRALLQFDRPQNRALVLEALQKTGREDLIGFWGRLPDSTRRTHGGRRRSRKKAARDGKGPKDEGFRNGEIA